MPDLRINRYLVLVSKYLRSDGVPKIEKCIDRELGIDFV